MSETVIVIPRFVRFRVPPKKWAIDDTVVVNMADVRMLSPHHTGCLEHEVDGFKFPRKEPITTLIFRDGSTLDVNYKWRDVLPVLSDLIGSSPCSLDEIIEREPDPLRVL